MTAHALDTLAIAGKLKAAGFSEAQAEAVRFVLRDAREADASNAATKGDIQTLELRLEAKIEATNAAIQANIQAPELRLEAGKAETIKWVVSAISFQTIVLVGAVVALSRLFQS